jgi:hypothetical protein
MGDCRGIVQLSMSLVLFGGGLAIAGDRESPNDLNPSGEMTASIGGWVPRPTPPIHPVPELALREAMLAR